MKTIKSTVSGALAALVLGLLFVGCLNDSGSSTGEPEDVRLVIQTNVTDVNKVNGLAKSSVITLDRLIITLTSSNPGDSVRRDTVHAADTVGSTFTSDATDDQVFSRNFLVKPLRSWTVVVKVLDVNDSVVHFDSTVAEDLIIGETRPVTVNLSSRFVMYEAKFSIPDSLNFTLLDLKQQLTISRVAMLVDGDTVADSSSAGSRFSSSPAVHTVRFDYIDVNTTPDVDIQFYGYVGDDTTTTLLFSQVFEDVDPTDPDPSGETAAEYVGPNSSELGSTVGLTIEIGKVGTVVFEPVIDPEVTSKRAAIE